MCTMKGEDLMGGIEPTKANEKQYQYNNDQKIDPAKVDAANQEALVKGLAGNNSVDLDKGLVVQSTKTEDKANPQDIVQNPDKNTASTTRKVVGALGVAAMLGGAVLVATGIAAPLGVGLCALGAATTFSSCAPVKEPDAPNTSVVVSVLNKDMADYTVNFLNNPDEAEISNNNINYDPVNKILTDKITGETYDLSKTTPDGLNFEYGYDYDSSRDIAKPYITIGDNVKLYISPNNEITASNVVNYITQVGDDLTTSEEFEYQYTVNNEEVNIAFDNGLTHTMGESASLDPNGTTKQLYNILYDAGVQVPTNDGELMMDVKAPSGSYNNAPDKGFELSFVTPTSVGNITRGNPVIKGRFGDMNFEGEAVKSQANQFMLEVNGKQLPSKAGGIYIKNDNGEELYLQTENDFDLQRVNDPEGANVWSGTSTVVYVKEPGTNLFKEKYILSAFDDGITNIGLIDRSEDGTFIQHFSNANTNFNARKNVSEAEDYYKIKENNLKLVQNTADINVKYLNQWDAFANADVNIIH